MYEWLKKTRELKDKVVRNRNRIVLAGALLIANAKGLEHLSDMEREVVELRARVAVTEQLQDLDTYTACRAFLSSNPMSTEDEDDVRCKAYLDERRQAVTR
ncbi:hypothetical protein A2872_03005 [Candidatus Gottesmanbacteria bacterium RIFCSPHIGHO2_01_FULL_42_12]|uniref:Uncharacterized protein n=1 Tax=Candidatus Gottesmanbacteria bacterium RIFCSPHIGHO2_01_FULL_42_12 TaxID=1798377 RepID=A0A1F5Z5J1_9BACT|nr:MAG: hypothetical protein A2872_03005 [Candidatus Gottesmanbacteria bacterium RIFCSPHIGHO2_01_FULL_42_12]